MLTLKLLALAIGPGIGIAVFIYIRDKYEKEPIGLCIKCFLLGMLSTLPAILLERAGAELGFGISETSVIRTLVFAFLVVGLSEEFSKYAFLNWYAYPKKDFNEPFDGIVYAVMISMGFATLENIMYVFSAESVAESLNTAYVRMFTAVPLHATAGVIMGYFVGMSKFVDPVRRFGLKMMGLAAAVLFHGAYDFFLFVENIPGLFIGAFVSLIIAIWLSFKAIKAHQKNSPFKNDFD
ncbi:MAG: PrsW family intramembrane metalloprotease [Bacteroidetes bacterium]|nr:PrsW family intramembrane metalloprotease [Bacteroidota bacterium]